MDLSRILIAVLETESYFVIKKSKKVDIESVKYIFGNVRNSSSSISETIVLRSVPTRSASTATCFDRSEETRRGRKKRSRSQYIN